MTTQNSEIEKIDATDLKILSLLIENANMPYTEIGKRVFVSGGTVHVRMDKLEKMGVVKGAQLIVNPADRKSTRLNSSHVD